MLGDNPHTSSLCVLALQVRSAFSGVSKVECPRKYQRRADMLLRCRRRILGAQWRRTSQVRYPRRLSTSPVGRVISHIHVGVDTRHGTESIHRHRKTDQTFCLQMREAVFRVGMAMLLLLLMMIVNVAGRLRERRGASLPVGEMGPGGNNEGWG